MEWTALISPAVTIVLAVASAIVATKNHMDTQMSDVKSHIATQDARIVGIEREQGVLRDLVTSVAELKTEIRDLRRDVEKHNGILERTYKLESDMSTQWKRVDEIRDELHGMRMGT